MGLGIRKINAHYCSLAASPKPKAAKGKRSKLGSIENKFKFKIYKSAAGVAAQPEHCHCHNGCGQHSILL